jgi:hypothetical protein
VQRFPAPAREGGVGLPSGANFSLWLVVENASEGRVVRHNLATYTAVVGGQVKIVDFFFGK